MCVQLEAPAVPVNHPYRDEPVLGLEQGKFRLREYAQRYPNDRAAYTDEKQHVINRVLSVF